MHISSDPANDVLCSTNPIGGYEWWYFDGISDDERHRFVIIIYNGNPFSTAYNSQIEDAERSPRPSQFPAVSISVYEDQDPIYYSFTEYASGDCSFDDQSPLVSVGPHQMQQVSTDPLTYKLSLDEQLPSGDALKATLQFLSPATENNLFGDSKAKQSDDHRWNLVQPRAEVSGTIEVSVPHKADKKITFSGTGYHDHNTGDQPMRNTFTDWYWGRFHFDHATLVYYVMNMENEEQHQAWLISKTNQKVLSQVNDISLSDYGRSLLGLKPARRLSFQSEQIEVQVQQRELLDNGPFYQRYDSDAYLRIPELDVVESQSGITEYIYPERIYSRIFWPFVNMRIQYKTEGAHWVQKSPRLYRWTW